MKETQAEILHLCYIEIVIKNIVKVKKNQNYKFQIAFNTKNRLDSLNFRLQFENDFLNCFLKTLS